MIIKNANGHEFFIRVIMRGDRYGLKGCLVHDQADPMVEFYDYKYANLKTFGPRGQFVARYYASTLAAHPAGRGLCLHGGVPNWQVDAAALAPVLATARRLTESVAVLPSRHGQSG